MKRQIESATPEPQQPLGDSDLPHQPVETPYLTVEGCAAFLHLSVKAFRNLLAKHPHFPKSYLGKRTLRFDRDEVRAYVRYINSPEYRARSGRPQQPVTMLMHNRILRGNAR